MDIMITQWNTGNGYTVHGQRIGAVLLTNGGIVFADIDRGIDGFIPPDFQSGETMQSRVQYGYMHNQVEYWRTAEYFSDEAFQLYDELRDMARTAARSAESIKQNNINAGLRW